MEELFETIETSYVDMEKTRSSNTIETIVNINFGNNFHNHNGTNYNLHVQKNTGKHYQ